MNQRLELDTAVAEQPSDALESPAAASSPTSTNKEVAYRKHVASLKDRLLLFIRDGAWHKLAELAEWLAPRLPPEHAVQRFTAAGGMADRKLDHKCAEGQRLILKDILDAVASKKLVAVRTNEAGEEEVQSTPLADDRFDLDPEFENLLPRAPDEVKKLEERLLVEGPRDPLVAWKGQRKLVDGYTRFRFLSLLGRSCSVFEMEFADREAVKAWLRATHYGRRSYSPEMKAYVRGTDYLARKKQHGGARKKASGHSVHLKTAEAVAAEYSVDARTVRRDADFSEALDKVANHCGDEVREKVLSRVARWTRRDVERLAKLDKPTLQAVVRAALASGKRPKFPPPDKDKSPRRKSLSLPVGKPVEQVHALKVALGRKGLARLHAAMGLYLERQKGSQ